MSSRLTSDLVSNHQKVGEVLKVLREAVQDAGGTDEDLLCLRDKRAKRETLRQIAELIVGKSVSGDIYPVTVNYDLSFKGMVRAGGYDWVNSDITQKNFPIEGDGTLEVTIELVHFDRYMTADEALFELDKRGLRAATLPELLAFGETHPDVQREFPIIALGSVWQSRSGRRYVPCLWSRSDERFLDLGWFEFRWHAVYRFAAVRK